MKKRSILHIHFNMRYFFLYFCYSYNFEYKIPFDKFLICKNDICTYDLQKIMWFFFLIFRYLFHIQWCIYWGCFFFRSLIYSMTLLPTMFVVWSKVRMSIIVRGHLLASFLLKLHLNTLSILNIFVITTCWWMPGRELTTSKEMKVCIS